jgi:hypothetical protein
MGDEHILTAESIKQLGNLNTLAIWLLSFSPVCILEFKSCLLG